MNKKFDVNCACFPKEKQAQFTKKGEIHELFVSAPFLVWFAGAAPERKNLGELLFSGVARVRLADLNGPT